MKIMDVHWHAVLDIPDMHRVMKRHDIEKVFVMPLEFGSMSWDDIIAHSRLGVKDGYYMQEVLHRLWNVNTTLARKFKGRSEFVFCSWESACPAVRSPSLSTLDAKVAFFNPLLDHVTASYFYDMIARIQQLDQQIIPVHTGWGMSIEPLIKVFDTFPERTFIMKHMKEDDDSYNDMRKYVLRTRNNVYAETSYCPHPKRIEQYVKLGYGSKLLFGSDFRTLDDESTLAYFIKMIELARIDDDVKEDIFYNNASELLENSR